MRIVLCLALFGVLLAQAASSPYADFSLPSVSNMTGTKRDNQYCCTYHTTSCCSDYYYPQCCDGDNAQYCCGSSSWCCVSTSYDWTMGKCCTYDRCCPSSSGYTVQCCGYDEVCCDHECASSCSSSSIGMIVGIIVGVAVFICFVVLIAVVIAKSNKNKHHHSSTPAYGQPIQAAAAPPPGQPVYAAGVPPGYGQPAYGQPVPTTIQSGVQPAYGQPVPNTIQSGSYGQPVPNTIQSGGPYPGTTVPTTIQSGPYPGAQQQGGIDPRLQIALQTVRQGIVVALVGISNDRISTDDGITVMALATSEALGKCQCTSQAEFDHAASLIFQYMNNLFVEIVPSMGKEQREALITTVLQRMTSLAQQQKRARIEEALDAIKQTFITVWSGVVANKISLEDAQQLMGVAVAAALRNCSIANADQLNAHVNAFTQWMLIVANECAPSVPPEVKQQVITKIWENAATHF